MNVISGGTWTYSGNPATDNKDAVRFLIGDTDSTDQQVSDEEILFLLDFEAQDIYDAASQCCSALASTYARLSDKQVGDLRITLSNQSKAYADNAQRLHDRAVHNAALASAPFNASQSSAEVQNANDDTDRVPPPFQQGQTDNPMNPQTANRFGLPTSDPQNV